MSRQKKNEKKDKLTRDFCSFCYRKVSKKRLLRELKEAVEKNTFLREQVSRLSAEQSLREGINHVCSSTMRQEPSESRNESVLLSTMTSWTLGTLNIPECVPAEGENEIDKSSYEYWKETLLASLQLVNSADENAKFGVFKVKAGAKLREIFNTTVSASGMPDERAAPFSNAVARLDDYFGSRTYILAQRSKLMSLSQTPTESSTEFVQRIATSAKLCNYSADAEMEAVVRVITKGASDIKVRTLARRNWVKQGTMKDLIDLVREREYEKACEEEELQKLRRHSVTDSVNIAAVSTSSYDMQGQRQINWRGRGVSRGTFRANRGIRRGTRVFNQAMLRNQSGTNCWRCGSFSHRSYSCPATEKVCHKCGRMGHIARACTSSNRQTQARSWKRSADSVEHGTPRKIAAIESKFEHQEADNQVQDTIEDPE